MQNIPFHLENQCLKPTNYPTTIQEPAIAYKFQNISAKTCSKKRWLMNSIELRQAATRTTQKRRLLRWFLHPSLVRGWIVRFIWTYCQIGLIDFSKIGAKNPKTLNHLSHGLNKTRFKQHQCLHPFWVFAFGVIVSRCVNSFQNKSAKLVWFIHKKVQVTNKKYPSSHNHGSAKIRLFSA